MPSPDMPDLEDAQRAYDRVKVEIEAVDTARLSPRNVDVVHAASVALEHAPRLLTLRASAARLPDFNLGWLDKLSDYAKALWLLHVTNLPMPDPEQRARLAEEVFDLRAKLLLWAHPLVAEGIFAPSALDQIRGGRGRASYRTAAGDVVALVALYRANWDQACGRCGITAEVLARGAELGFALFAEDSRHEHAPKPGVSKSLMVSKAWTLLDLAYKQCQRAVAYLRFAEGDAATFAPNLRRNRGRPPIERDAAAGGEAALAEADVFSTAPVDAPGSAAPAHDTEVAGAGGR